MAINKRKTPDVNASSQADIAFLLLIFFLVATTMNTDAGINRTLPPWSEDVVEQERDINERNLLQVRVNQYDQILAAGKEVQIFQLKDIAKDFFLNRNNDPDLPVREVKEIELIGSYPVSQGVISLQNDRGTSYEMYIMVQNELTRAVNEIRDQISIERFGATFNELDEARRKAVQEAQPTAISEAEPRNLGGN